MGDEDDAGIGHGAFDLGGELIVLLELDCQKSEHLFQVAARLPHPHHADEEIAEDLGVLGETVRERRAVFHLFPHLQQYVAEIFVLGLLEKGR